MKCLACGKLIHEKPCPYCGNTSVEHLVHIEEAVKVSDDTEVCLVASPSLVTIENLIEGNTQTFAFSEGSNATDIVNSSLEASSLKGKMPPELKRQFVSNISSLERYAKIETTEVSDEHSFELNLGFFKYKYTRINKRRKK